MKEKYNFFFNFGIIFPHDPYFTEGLQMNTLGCAKFQPDWLMT